MEFLAHTSVYEINAKVEEPILQCVGGRSFNWVMVVSLNDSALSAGQLLAEQLFLLNSVHMNLYHHHRLEKGSVIYSPRPTSWVRTRHCTK